MATVKSKLKEQLQKEKDLATESLIDVGIDEGREIARMWVESIQRIEKVCKERNRY